MQDLIEAFNERLEEIESYLELLKSLQQQIQLGPPTIGEKGSVISVKQQRILYSSVFLQLYNLVESTVSRCVEAFCSAINNNGQWLPSDLSESLRSEWVRSMARTHVELSHKKRLEAALDLCNHILQSLPLKDFKVEKGGGGNWDHKTIKEVSDRLGISLCVSAEVYQAVSKPFRNDQGPLVYIRSLRNDLAHGTVSFAECGEGITVNDLCDLKEKTANYLAEVVNMFKIAIDGYEFLLPSRRPGSTERNR